jgi:hypothetical protein
MPVLRAANARFCFYIIGVSNHLTLASRSSRRSYHSNYHNTAYYSYMSHNNNSQGYTYRRCQGSENFSAHCTHNGPSKAVWIQIMVAALLIFGLFCCHLNLTRKRQNVIFEWNNDDDDTDVENDVENHNQNSSSTRKERPYHDMDRQSILQRSVQRSLRMMQMAVQGHTQNEQQQEVDSSGTYQAPTVAVTNICNTAAAGEDQDEDASKTLMTVPAPDQDHTARSKQEGEDSNTAAGNPMTPPLTCHQADTDNSKQKIVC